MAFRDFEYAKDFYYDFGRFDFRHYQIWECEVVNPAWIPTQFILTPASQYSLFKKYWTDDLGNITKSFWKIKEQPLGTIFADAIKLLKQCDVKDAHERLT